MRVRVSVLNSVSPWPRPMEVLFFQRAVHVCVPNAAEEEARKKVIVTGVVAIMHVRTRAKQRYIGGSGGGGGGYICGGSTVVNTVVVEQLWQRRWQR